MLARSSCQNLLRTHLFHFHFYSIRIFIAFIVNLSAWGSVYVLALKICSFFLAVEQIKLHLLLCDVLKVCTTYAGHNGLNRHTGYPKYRVLRILDHLAFM